MSKSSKTWTLRRVADHFTSIGLLLLIGFLAAHFGGFGEARYQGSFRVIDGDSLQLEEDRFRLEGIDAPEYRQTCGQSEAIWPCGKQAAGFLRNLMKDETIGCKGVGVDKYGRTLVRCSSPRLDVNREMVANGWAVAYGDYHEEERQSRTSRLGIWAGDFDMPKDWRDAHGDVIDTNADHGLLNNLLAKARMWTAALLNYFKE